MLMTKDGITRDVEKTDVSKFIEMGFKPFKVEPEEQPRQDNVEVVSEKVVSKRSKNHK